MFDLFSVVELVEIVLVGIIVMIQLTFFLNTQRNISRYRNCIPQASDLSVVQLNVPQSELNTNDPAAIIRKYKDYITETQLSVSTNEGAFNYSENEDYESSGELEFETNQKSSFNSIGSRVDLSIVIAKKNQPGGIFAKIQSTINRYLIRNAGISADFNLLKDVVERNVGAIEEDINMSIPVPLYLGLVGTMMGIVIGLFGMGNLDAIAAGESNGSSVGILIGGVKIAMIASFIGLLLTLVSSGITFRSARSFVEARKHEFYSFLQFELLPVLNLNMVSTLESMQRNLMKFNQEFSHNLQNLGSTFKDSITAVKGQRELLQALDKAKLSEMARYNVNVLQQLNTSMGQLSKFNNYLGSLNGLVAASERILEQSNRFIDRTANFESIAANIDQTLTRSSSLSQFLQDHFNKLDEFKDITQKAVEDQKGATQKVVSDVGFEISDIFKELHEHIMKSSLEVQRFTDTELDALKSALSSSKTNLSNLEHLSSIQEEFAGFKKASQSQNDKIIAVIKELSKNVEASNHLLYKISTSPRSRFTTWIKNIFGSS